MTTKIYLIRHAEAEGNLYRRSQGQYNSNVTPLGRVQLGALAERFRDEPLDALWSSDLNRTRSTAAAILKYHPELQLRLSPRLREIDVGVWEDRPWGNIAADYPEQMELFTHDPARWSVPGGEPYEEVAARMRTAVLDIAARHPGGTAAVVTHGLAIRSLLCHILGVPSERIDSVPYGDNTSVSLVTVEEDGRLSAVWYNDASHLQARGLSTFSRQSWWRDEVRQKPAAKVYARFLPLDPGKEGELYTHVYAETWRASHGNIDGFAPAVYLRTALAHAERDPRCVMKLYAGDDFAGVIELDPDRGGDIGVGWISLLYIAPARRKRRLGIQLIGHAISYFRREGRTALRLHVSETNENAIGFYTAAGFVPVGKTQGVGGALLLMEADIRPRVLTPEEII